VEDPWLGSWGGTRVKRKSGAELGLIVFCEFPDYELVVSTMTTIERVSTLCNVEIDAMTYVMMRSLPHPAIPRMAFV
jgi:hypothetical protein